VEKMSLVISIISLLTSVAAFGLSAFVAIRNARLQTAQIRTELLTKLYDVRVGYTRFNRRISALRHNPPDPLPLELKTLFESEAGFQQFERDTERYRRALLEPGHSLDAQALLNLRHHTDAMAKQTEDDSRRLDEILARGIGGDETGG
jgi:hypothetical protein